MTTNDFDIATKTGRRRLQARREPYWSRVEAGAYVGFRVLAEGSGTWIGRWRADDGKQHYRALGHFDDFDDATKAARAWFDSCQQGSPRATTVEGACCSYIADRKIAKGDRCAADAEGRFRRLVFGTPFGRIALDKLKPSDIRRWRDAHLTGVDPDDPEAIRRAKDSANRTLASLKAALNLAYRERLIPNDSAWRTVPAFAGVGRRREIFLTSDQRRALLAAAPDDLGVFLMALLLTGCRPGEAAALNAGDFDRRSGLLTLDGKTGRRVVAVSTEARAFFEQQAKAKLPSAPMFSRSDGQRWNRHAWKVPMTAAVAAAGLPSDVVTYCIRHTAISEMIASGIDLLAVARLVGTSIAMIDKHYGHLRHANVVPALDRVKLL